ncbi:U-box domain-containing protein 33-like isoform X2 [Rutidosis leptorrhynchoides]|uniref:U-box domain-containing protein 33-like isoform X2 n=1 Tax=Rutidosis leptorrhynchoides TaxID=125765 RepID=UPI003A9A0459
MAVVSSVSVEGARTLNQMIRYPVVDTSEIVETRDEIVAETNRRVVDNDDVYVAVGKEIKDSLLTLRWALYKYGDKQICILHVHQPAQKIPMMGTKFPVNQLDRLHVEAYHEAERQEMLQLLGRYKQMCLNSGVRIGVQYIEMGSIEKGIVEFILQNNVRRLVMGAATDRHYSRRMVNLRSRKAIYVCLEAAASCQIQFVCKGNLIFTKEVRLGEPDVSTSPPSPPININSDSGLTRRSVSERENSIIQPDNSNQDYHRVVSDSRGTGISSLLSDLNLESTPPSRLNPGMASDEWTEFSQTSPSERGVNDELYVQLAQAMAEADNSKRDAFEESIRRRKAEKDAIEAIHRVRTSENLYAEELRRRLEINGTLEKTKEEHEYVKKELYEVAEEFRIALEQKLFLETQITVCDRTVRELEQKMFSAVELLQTCKKERDELQIECNDVLRLVEELRENQTDDSLNSSVSHFYSEFSFSEVKDATCNFDPFLKIGEGGYGSIFRGFIRHTEVAVKMLNSHSLQGPSEFQQELLTGKPVLKLAKEVQDALKTEKLNKILDPTAGDWPYVVAQQLARLALNCCDRVRKNRPDLASEVWRVLEPMQVFCGISGRRQIPHYFICPIFLEVMQDPVVAADGFTYEAEAIRGWLDSGHKTSPMTNLELPNTNLVPNLALRSAIQEWLQQPWNHLIQIY